MPALIANSPQAPVSRLELQPGINTLGRAPGNHLVIPDGSISSRHCEIICDDDTISVRDLGSTNGTFIDGRPAQQQTLAHGQRIKFGGMEYILEAPEIPAAPRPGTLRVHVQSAPAAPVLPQPAGQSASESIAALAATVDDGPGFYALLPGAFAYPFKKNGLILLIVGGVFFLVLEFFARFSWVISIITTGYLFAYMQKIIAHSAQGEDEMPDFPEFGEWWSDILLPFLLFVGTFVVSFAPAIALFFLLKGEFGVDGAGLVFIAALAFGAVYFPMALLAVAVSDNFLALSPHIVVPSMFRVFLPYAVACVILAVLVAFKFGSQFLVAFLPVPVVPSILMGFVSLYALVVEMRVLGLLFRSYRARLGWLG